MENRDNSDVTFLQHLLQTMFYLAREAAYVVDTAVVTESVGIVPLPCLQALSRAIDDVLAIAETYGLLPEEGEDGDSC